MLVCNICRKNITGSYIDVNGQPLHLECFKCAACGEPMGDGEYFERDGHPYHESCFQQQFNPRCAACDQVITGAYTTALGKQWHPGHFVCEVCKRPFSDHRYYEQVGRAYCERDYHEHFSPRCSVCATAMRGQYIVGQWGEEYCAHHEHQLPHCFSCSRPVCDRLTGGGIRYSDGRHICNLCRSHSVTTISDAERLLESVRRCLAGYGMDLGRAKLPLRLPMWDELKGSSSKVHSDEPTGMARIRSTTRDGVIVDRDIEEVLVLYGVTEEQFQAIAAHELMHAWLFLNGYDHLPPVVEEGLCELASYLWLRDRNSPEAAYHLRLLQHKDDPVYGAGFHAARDALEGHLVTDVLAYVRTHRYLPVRDWQS